MSSLHEDDLDSELPFEDTLDFSNNVYIHVPRDPNAHLHKSSSSVDDSKIKTEKGKQEEQPTGDGDEDEDEDDEDLKKMYAELYIPSHHKSTEPKEKKRRRRRKLDVEKSLKKYEARLLAMPDLKEQLQELEGAYLATFSIFSTEKHVRTRHSNNAFVLMRLARQFDINVKAVTSECKVQGKYRAPLLDGDTRDSARILYVGNYNYFTGHPESKWALKPCDKAYMGYC